MAHLRDYNFEVMGEVECWHLKVSLEAQLLTTVVMKLLGAHSSVPTESKLFSL